MDAETEDDDLDADDRSAEADDDRSAEADAFDDDDADDRIDAFDEIDHADGDDAADTVARVGDRASALPTLTGKALVKEVCRLIRAARSHWDMHHNGATRLARRKAMRLYETLSREQREQVPQVLRVWLRYRSEKYYGPRKKKKKKAR